MVLICIFESTEQATWPIFCCNIVFTYFCNFYKIDNTIEEKPTKLVWHFLCLLNRLFWNHRLIFITYEIIQANCILKSNKDIVWITLT